MGDYLMKITLNKILSAIMFAVVILFLSNLNTFAAIERDNCHDHASGIFKFSVEPAIKLEASGDFNIGSICPGCGHIYNTSCCYDGNPLTPHIFFTATGGYDCMYSVEDYYEGGIIHNGQAGEGDINMAIVFNYFNGSIWTTWGHGHNPVHFNVPQPGQPGYGVPGMGIAQFVAFICNIQIGCNVPPGDYSNTYYMFIEYACAH